jgi:NAD(P)-dependent dehydrogenase (short-subunit alcohol dehydrogenase family)
MSDIVSHLKQIEQKLINADGIPNLNTEERNTIDRCHKISKLYKKISVQTQKKEKRLSINNLYKVHLRTDLCYLCKTIIIDSSPNKYMCETCFLFNDRKRVQTNDLSHKIAIVTGGRIKIGFYTALKLLRSNVYVIVTTRFTEDALIRYKQEQDYELWKDNLYIFECDFLYMTHINNFIAWVKTNFNHIDYLINNAAQTIARPKEFYQSIGYKTSSDLITVNKYFPVGQYDEHGQQLDLRPANSWVETIETVNISELAEVMLINSIAPFYLIQHLIPLLSQSNSQESSYVINASSMEGKFNRSKSEFHPHTNMAKASLNMMTKTSGHELKKKYGIIMVCVDTGWNTIEEPLSYDIKSPLDCIDGAARLLDPIYNKLLKSGIFYKDFVETEW